MKLRKVLAFLESATLAAVVATTLGGCAASTGEEDDELGSDEGALGEETDDAVTQTAWQNIGFGVDTKSLDGGSNILIVYGGYSAQSSYVQRWTNELYRAKGTDLELGHLYSVKGPNQSLYANREIQNSRLVAHLAANGRAANASSIIVLAHSSGAFVANEFVAMLRANRGGIPSDTLGKVTLFNLDGGGGIPASSIAAMKNAYYVYACDNNLGRCSKNAGSMRSLGQQFQSHGGPIKVDATGSGCSSSAGGLWCLHDTLITTRPHNPSMYDLRRDYTTFGGSRKVVTSFFDVL